MLRPVGLALRARLRRCGGFAFFFMAQPPLLSQEGNCPPQIDSQVLINEGAVIDRAYNCKTRPRIHRKAFGMKGFQVLFMLLVIRES